jgi:Uma2 family endonuclease
LVCDPIVAAELATTRAQKGLDTYDEVWNGLPVIMSLPNDEYQFIATQIAAIICVIFNFKSPPHVRAGVNVSDRVDDWMSNHRCPDVAVYFESNSAVNHGTHWVGGPDFLVEIISPGDPTWEKLPFYASINTREVLIIDRDPWRLELYQLRGGEMARVEECDLTKPEVLKSSVLPLTFQLVAGTDRPQIEVIHPPTNQSWRI